MNLITIDSSIPERLAVRGDSCWSFLEAAGQIARRIANKDDNVLFHIITTFYSNWCFVVYFLEIS